MPKQPTVSGAETLRALERAGFIVQRQRGSHVMMRNPQTERRATVPIHAGEDLRPGTLASILRQAGLTVAQFAELLK